MTTEAVVKSRPVVSAGSITKGRKRPADVLAYIGIYASAAFSVLLLVGIIGYVLVKGYSMISWSFLTGVTSVLNDTVGIAGNILNTLYIIVLTMLIATPIGIGAAVYLNEYAKPGKLVTAIEFATQILSGIPSIIFGLFGMIFFGQTLHLSYCILTGALTLVLMVLPLVIRNTQEALKTVPDSYRQGAIGLLFTAGSDGMLPITVKQFLDKIFASGGTLTIQLYLSMSKGQYDVAFGIAVVLLVIVLLINMLTKLLAHRFDVHTRE